MHAKLLVLVRRGVVEDEDAASSYAERELEDQGFVGQDGIFSRSPSDWFEIGGRFVEKEKAVFLLDNALYDHLVKNSIQWLGDTSLDVIYTGKVFIKLDADFLDEPLSLNDVGKWWVVTVDFHW